MCCKNYYTELTYLFTVIITCCEWRFQDGYFKTGDIAERRGESIVLIDRCVWPTHTGLRWLLLYGFVGSCLSFWKENGSRNVVTNLVFGMLITFTVCTTGRIASLNWHKENLWLLVGWRTCSQMAAASLSRSTSMAMLCGPMWWLWWCPSKWPLRSGGRTLKQVSQSAGDFTMQQTTVTVLHIAQ